MIEKYSIAILPFIIIFSVLKGNLCAQHDVYLQDLAIERDGQILKLSNVGGFNAPQYSPIDLNNDGIEDLLVFDRSCNMAYTFINKGIANTIAYEFAPEYMPIFDVDAQNFMLAKDYNCDGIADLFFFTYSRTSYESGIQVLKGSYDSENKIQFTLAKDFLKYDFRQFQGNYIFMYNPDIPALVDIDNDGDLDILAFTLDVVFSRNVFFYKNMSMERGYGCDSLNFHLFSECFGQFSETDINNTVIYSGSTDSCGGNPYWRHVGSTLSAFDHNGDGIQDLIMGDVDINTLNLLTLSQVSDTLLVIAQDATFPHYDTPVGLYTFPAAYFLDVNNDGKTDMIAANNDISALNSVKDSTSWLYLNRSNSNTANFNLYSKGFMYEDMLDFGLDAQPSFIDLDNDGLIDIVVANSLNIQNNTNKSAGLVWLKNIGTSSTPLYIIADEDLAGLKQLNSHGFAVAFADMDNDGWQDMLVAYGEGLYKWYKHNGLVQNMPQLVYTPSSFEQIRSNYSNYNVPTLYDLDNDGDFDLVVGTARGTFSYYENIGNRYTPIFAMLANTEQFGNIDLYYLISASRASAHFFRDSNQELQMLVGSSHNRILHFSNIEENLLGSFDLVTNYYKNIQIGSNQRLALADINGDNLLDILVGNVRGGLTFYSSQLHSNIEHIVVEVKEENVFKVYPNPSHNIVEIELNKLYENKTALTVHNSLGQILLTETILPFTKNYSLNLSNFTAGIYYIHLHNKVLSSSIKLVHQP